MSVDDLIAEYKRRIAERDEEIERLLKELQEKNDELARLSGTQLSLKEIEAVVDALEKDAMEAKRKRDSLEEDGDLDPELRALIDSILKAIKKMRKKVDKLIALDEKAKEDRLEAEREAKAAADAAKKDAKEKGLSVKETEELAKKAEEDARSRTKEKTKKADLEAMKAAQEVGKDVKEAEEGAKKLDTGLHPHGAKWWRYRYEHSYIEALLMVFISFLMVFWSKVFGEVRYFITKYAYRRGSAWDPVLMRSQQLLASEEDRELPILVTWFQYFGEQMFVCIFVFLTVWLIAKSFLLNYAPVLIEPSEDMRVPDSPNQYRELALDICTIFFFAIVFYFLLMLPVALDASRVMEDLVRHETLSPEASNRSSEAEESTLGGRSVMSAMVMGQVAQTREAYLKEVDHFRLYMEQEKDSNPDIRKVNTLMGDQLQRFPLADYLMVNIRNNVSSMFYFGWLMWLPIICAFVGFMLLHRFAHMGYIRIMIGFAVATVVLLVAMGWLTRTIKADRGLPGTGKTVHNKYSTEVAVLTLLQFTLFFMCYGVARMICQPWMWELHFWPVLSLTMVAVFCALLFIVLVSPAFPSFCAAMSLPPYVDGENIQLMIGIAKKVNERSQAEVADTPRAAPERKNSLFGQSRVDSRV
jgi:hypothetical protein